MNSLFEFLNAVFNKLPILYFLSLAPVSSFGILKQYLQPGYDPPARKI